jgi:hypothetical protein
MTRANYDGCATAGVHFLGVYGIQLVAIRTAPTVTCNAIGQYSSQWVVYLDSSKTYRKVDGKELLNTVREAFNGTVKVRPTELQNEHDKAPTEGIPILPESTQPKQTESGFL